MTDASVLLTRSQINNWMLTIEKSTDRKRTLRCPVFLLRDGASLPHRKGVVCVSPQVLAKVDAVCEDVRHFSYLVTHLTSQNLAPSSCVSATFNRECWVNVFVTTVRPSSSSSFPSDLPTRTPSIENF